MPLQHTIRRATTDDVEAIESVAAMAWAATYEGILADETIDALFTVGYSTEALEAEIEDPDSSLFLLEVDGEVAGFASSHDSDIPLEGEMSIYIDPDYWGDGFGKDLLDRVEEDLRERGVETISESVLEANAIGIAFYEKHFELANTREIDVGGETHIAHIYERAL